MQAMTHRPKLRIIPVGCLAGALSLLSACSTTNEGDDNDKLARSPWAAASLPSVDPTGWQHQPFPGKRATEYRHARKEGRDAIMVRSQASASMLRQRVRIEPAELGQLRFSWLVPALVAGADMAQRDADDSPVRLVLAFEGDRSRFSAKNAALSELSEMLTGEPLPYATLMYVWSNGRAPGTVLHNPRTDRVRKLVMESGALRLSQWLDYERNVRADFIQAFGEPPGALLLIGIMTDTDNTRSQAMAWYGPLQHRRGGATRRPAPAE